MMAELLVQEGYNTPAEVAELSPRSLLRLLNLEQDQALKLIENAKVLAESQVEEEKDDDVETQELLANASARPVDEVDAGEVDTRYDERVNMFLQLSGVGEATAYALADGGYGTIGDIIADSAEEVSQKTGIALGVARTVQMAADRYLQSE